jgi:hypothetical protein
LLGGSRLSSALSSTANPRTHSTAALPHSTLGYISEDSNSSLEQAICGDSADSIGSTEESISELRRQQIQGELSIQLANYKQSVVKLSYRSDPLAFWRVEGRAAFPLLAPVARYCFSMLASSAAVERAFKCGKFVSRQERGNTGDDCVDILSVLAYTYKKDPAAFMKRIQPALPVASDSSEASPEQAAPFARLFSQ